MTTRGPSTDRKWSTLFLAPVVERAMANRLARGRTYYRQGHVGKVMANFGNISTTVQGSGGQKYQVRVNVTEFDADEWNSAEEAIAVSPQMVAALQAGTVPTEIIEVFASVGVPLMPSSPSEMRVSCSCPDSAVPCKHGAAVLYYLAHGLDANPFLIFHLRGQTQENLISNVLWELENQGDPSDPYGDLFDDPSNESMDMGPFWLCPNRVPRAPVETMVGPTDAALRALDPMPIAIRGTSLSEMLGPVYDTMVAGAAKRLVEAASRGRG